MGAFDAERYLREIGERQLLDPDPPHHHRHSALEDPAGVLISAGVVSVDVAQSVLDDYMLATTLRSRGRFFGSARAPGPRPAAHLEARTIVVLDHTLDFGGGRLLLRDLAIGATAGTLRFRWRRDDHRRGRRGHMFGGGGLFPWGSTAPTVADEQGNPLTISPDSGSGSGAEWEGKLTVTGPIAPDLAWLDIEGTRVPVDREITPHEIRLQPLPQMDPVHRWLWRRLAVADRFHHRDARLDGAIAAVIAAGALPADDPELADMQAIAAQMPTHPHHSPPGTGNVRSLPEPWRALLRRRGTQDGPARTLLLGAVSPPFDGIQAGVHSVASDPDGFDTEFEISPGIALGNTALGELPVCWWARDDRGNHYLGSPTDWGSSPDSAGGTMRYWPALDPLARRLDLIVGADTHQAVFAITMAPLEDGRS